ncbi:hypothetical protein QYE76_019736 [Lolium multiflorum]|uniref:F-box domain-containing protein n=1 Tax=Lolium multiflorum TaxID=4521 RepID=A0AAD8R732_LOLMU|nr:hypothetical protein QYE76_019736 [Lolium multiflorum]
MLGVLLPGSDLRYPCVLRESGLPRTGWASHRVQRTASPESTTTISCEEEGDMRTASLGRRPHSPAAGPLEDDDLLREILIRLPPQPSSLPRASAVCKRWRRLVSDPAFFRRFRLHHRRSWASSKE